MALEEDVLLNVSDDDGEDDDTAEEDRVRLRPLVVLAAVVVDRSYVI